MGELKDIKIADIKLLCVNLKIASYGSKLVIKDRLKKYYLDNHLGEFNIESLINLLPHNLTTTTEQTQIQETNIETQSRKSLYLLVFSKKIPLLSHICRCNIQANNNNIKRFQKCINRAKT